MRTIILTLAIMTALVAFAAQAQAQSEDEYIEEPVPCPGCGPYQYPALDEIFGIRMGAHISKYVEDHGDDIDVYEITPPIPNVFLDRYAVWVDTRTNQVFQVEAVGENPDPVDNEARFEYIKFLITREFEGGEEISYSRDYPNLLREYRIKRDDGSIIFTAWMDRVTFRFFRHPDTLPDLKDE